MFPVEVIGAPPPTDKMTMVSALDASRLDDWHVAEETPVAFVYNRRNHAVMLATPADMADFALGFSLTERIVNKADDILALEIRYLDNGIELFFKIEADRLTRLDVQARRRNLVGTAGCGLCGLDNADHILAPLKPVADTFAEVGRAALERAMQGFGTRQPINQRTKSVHGAAWVSLSGEIEQVREDVGRHNALDKLIGAMALAKTNPAEGFLLMSSRCSYEIIDKAARCGIGAILSLSGPTNLALTKARQANITLYARDKTGSAVRLGPPGS